MNRPTSEDKTANVSSTSLRASGDQQMPKMPNVVRRSNPSDLLKNLKSVDKKNQKKPTILEQAANDWNKCKVQDNLEDELKQATKSKSGYLERQRFLERADLRQFEKEREIRERARAKAALSRDN